jgi:hypothetical protein
MRSVEAQHAVPSTTGKRGKGGGNGAAVCCRESEGVPRLNSLESLFDKEGLREFGARGLNAPRQPTMPIPFWATTRILVKCDVTDQ